MKNDADRCSSSDDMDECRYKYLLQPIKDIASNWDIDIADSLSEYLEELDQLRISVDDGRSCVNFAEAALLIQGSAVVYSRKVEHLHSLVLRSLDCIARKTAGSSSKDKQVLARGTAFEDADILLFDSDPSFLLLDHVIEEGRNIDLRSKQLVTEDKVNVQNNSNNSRSSLNGSYSCEASRVSMSLLHSLIHDNDYDQGNAGLKLSTSVMDDSGALLLCGSLRPMSMSSGHNNASRSSWLDHCHAQSPMPEKKSAAVVEDPRLMNGDADDDEDDGIGNNCFEYDGGIDEHESIIDRAATPKKASCLFSSERPPQQPSKDWFAQLDPHQSAVEGSKEIRKGKTYKVPDRLLHPTQSDAVYPYCIDDPARDQMQSLLRLHQVPRRGLFDVTLAPILSLRRRLLRAERAVTVTAAGNRETAGSAKTKQQQQQQLSSSDEDRRLDRLRSAVEGGGDEMEQLWTNDFADAGDDDEEEDGYPAEVLEDFRSVEDGAVPVQDNEGGSDDYVTNEEDELARRLEKVLSDDLSSSSRSSYESICQQYISDFNKGADLFARETQLSRRVSEWTRRLEPILQLQEEGPQFDIRSYCDDVMTRTKSIARQRPERSRSIISFREVAHGKSSVEVGRMFLSCLQLTNQGDLDIVWGEPQEGLVPLKQMNNFCLSLKPAGSAALGRYEQSENNISNSNSNTSSSKSRNKRRDPHRKVHFLQEPSLML